MRSCYNTEQKELLLNIIKKEKSEFTVKDISNKTDVGLTTIYRFVDKLVKDGLLTKEIGNDNTTYYQYLEECDCDDHFYLKCTNCGVLIHVDCDCINDLSNHIRKKHDFKLSREHIIINGLCSKCSRK